MRMWCGIVLALIAGWFALRQAMDEQWAVTRPSRAAAAFPASSQALGMLAIGRVAEAGGVVDERARVLVAQALSRGPAEALPLAIAGLDASASGDLDRARRLMEMARGRDPRLPMVRVWLLNDDARRGDYAALLGEAGPVMRLSASSREQVYAMLAQMSVRPGGAQALGAALARQPDWAAPYRQWLAEQR